MTSSFWLQSKHTEIDVVEEIGAPELHEAARNEMFSNTHSFSIRDGKKTDQATPQKWLMPSGAADEFHIYGVWWKDKNTVLFYHNRQLVTQAQPAVDFVEPMYLFLDAEVFANYGLPSIKSLKNSEGNRMKVDWVHSWRLVPDSHK